jgi:RNA polymerase sigma-70 factor, ECF subfamily
VDSDLDAGGPLGSAAEGRFVQALRAGDEPAFATLVEKYDAAMLRVAGAHVPSREVAEEVVQDTWLALLQGLDGFEERSRLQTWLFRILINIARTRGVKERRCLPVSALAQRAADVAPLVDRFLQRERSEADSPELRAMSRETLRCVEKALAQLPRRQRVVVTLRDVVGFSAEEVCAALNVTPANQRVLLHRGRAWIRHVLERESA